MKKVKYRFRRHPKPKGPTLAYVDFETYSLAGLFPYQREAVAYLIDNPGNHMIVSAGAGRTRTGRVSSGPDMQVQIHRLGPSPEIVVMDFAEIEKRVLAMSARKVDPAAINFILEHPQPMTESEAQDYAPQWGSYIRDGDPGSVMYSAIPPERAEHRDEMISYIRLHCLPIASHNGAPDPEDGPNDIDQLRRLVAYLQCLTY